jgi:flagellar biosynthesis activator protein FlaF
MKPARWRSLIKQRNMGLEAYRRVQRTAESPRQSEYRLFAQVTAALINARDEELTHAPLVDVLDWNRRMWGTLSSDCAAPGNSLPNELRAQIISLGLWVSRYSSQVATQGANIDPLIDVNKSIMEGLSMRPEASIPATATASA